MGSGSTHASGVAGWAHATLLAREGDEQVFAARAAVCLQEAMRQDPALQVLAQLALDVLRQGTLVRLAGFCEKRLEVRGDDLVERRGFGFVPLVAFGRDERWPFGASGAISPGDNQRTSCQGRRTNTPAIWRSATPKALPLRGAKRDHRPNVCAESR